MYPVLPSLDASNWLYIAEGFNSILFRWVGDSSSSMNNKALRLFKQAQDPSRSRLSNDGERESFADLQNRYNENYIIPYLDGLDVGIVYSITTGFLESMAQVAEPYRPEKRRRESKIQMNSTICLIHDNLVPPGSISIEIKLKCGFKPDTPYVPLDSVKRKVSRFRMLQYLKVAKGEVPKFSYYEPEDIFSRDPARIMNALNALEDSPQCNLKMFKDGTQCPFDSNIKEPIVKTLSSCKILDQILALQKLDVFDVEGIIYAIDIATNPTWHDLCEKGVVSIYQKIVSGEIAIPNTREEADRFIDNMDIETSRAFIAAFLISQAARDCSIMITFDQSFENPKISVIDMDMKNPNLVYKRYYVIDQETCSFYLKQQSE